MWCYKTMLNEFEMTQVDEMLEKMDEMLDKFSKEEWRKYIDEEMERLGLEFVPDTVWSGHVFEEE